MVGRKRFGQFLLPRFAAKRGSTGEHGRCLVWSGLPGERFRLSASPTSPSRPYSFPPELEDNFVVLVRTPPERLRQPISAPFELSATRTMHPLAKARDGMVQNGPPFLTPQTPSEAFKNMVSCATFGSFR
jgi:hypothetical protein